MTVNEDGSFTYMPYDSSATSDSFQYRAFDGQNYSEPTTVTLSLSNPTPVATNDSYSINFGYGGWYNLSFGSVFDNDNPSWPHETVVVNSFTQPTGGYVDFDTYTGVFDFEPYSGFVGTTTFTYTLTDFNNESNTATVSITISNPSPVAQDDSFSGALGYGSSYISFGSVLTNDSDPNDSDPNLPLPAVGNYTSPQHGSVSFNSDGSFTYTLNGSYTGTDSFTYQAYDYWTMSSWATVTLEISAGLMLNVPEIAASAAPALATNDAQSLLRAAALRWERAGAERRLVRETVAGLKLQIVDLPGRQLGGATADGKLLLDIDAAGHGWFVDRSPLSDREFAPVSSSELTADDGSDLAERVALLTVVMHEIGHLLGLQHGDEQAGLMSHEIGAGTRRLQDLDDAALASWFSSEDRRKSR